MHWTTIALLGALIIFGGLFVWVAVAAKSENE